MADKAYRTEHDSMGELQVPADALWGAQTQRAVDNFPVSGLRMPRSFIAAVTSPTTYIKFRIALQM